MEADSSPRLKESLPDSVNAGAAGECLGVPLRLLVPLLFTAIVIASGFLSTWNNGFSYWYHGDESKKASFVLSGRQDYHHPLLMLQAGRLLNSIAAEREPQGVIEVCRNLSAAFAVLSVIVVYFLARRLFGEKDALVAMLAAAVSPILVVHAHYFKEDLFFLLPAMLTLLLFMRFTENSTIYSAAALGSAFGLAVSAQHKAWIIPLVFLVFPLACRVQSLKRYYGLLFAALLTGIAVLAAVNYPIFWELDILKKGLATELRHIAEGHNLKIYPIPFWFTFHLRYSLFAGIGLVPSILGLGGLILTLWSWKSESSGWKLLFLYTAAVYIVHEATPMKAAPDFMRYMIPIAPVWLMFALKAGIAVCRYANRCLHPTAARAGYIVVAVFVITLPLYDSYWLVDHMERDTRTAAEEWIRASGLKAACGYYGCASRGQRTLEDLSPDRLRGKGYELFVASSSHYERFYRGVKLGSQPEAVHLMHAAFEKLFSKPYLEIRPAYKSFAYSNPVIRIVDIRERSPAGTD